MQPVRALVKLSLILFAFAVFAGVAEVGLRWFARSQLPHEMTDPPESGNDAKADLLCIGNSHTAGVGAPPGKSYCQQLVNMAHGFGKSIVMENWGVPIFNTADILKDLEKRLPHTDAKVALVMAGEPNSFNYRGYSDYLRREKGESAAGAFGQMRAFLQDHSALYRLFLHIRLNVKSQEPTNDLPFALNQPDHKLEAAYRWLSFGFGPEFNRSLSEKQASHILEAMKLIKQQDPTNVAADLLMARIEGKRFRNWSEVKKILDAVPVSHEACLAFLESPFFDSIAKNEKVTEHLRKLKVRWEKKYSKAELDFVLKIVSPLASQDVGILSPSEPSILDQSKNLRDLFDVLSDCGSPGDLTVSHLIAAYARAGQYQLIIDRAIRYLNTLPFSPYVTPFQWLNLSAGVTRSTPELDLKIKSARKLFFERFGDQSDVGAELAKASVDRWTEVELSEIVRLLRSRGIDVVLMTYPPLPYRGVHPIKQTAIQDLPPYDVDVQIRKVAASNRVRLFDTWYVLRNRFQAEMDLKKYYGFKMGPVDGHLNADGYALLAEELFRYLDNEHLL